MLIRHTRPPIRLGGIFWFAESQGDHIGRITPDGIITQLPLPAAHTPTDAITSGPDGNLWVSESSGTIGKIVP